VALWPGVRVNGTVMPDPLMPAPEVVICEMVRFALPVLVIVIDCAPLLPTVMLPKFALLGAVSCATGAATPEPLRETAVGLFEALLTNEICPEPPPAVVGANCAL